MNMQIHSVRFDADKKLIDFVQQKDDSTRFVLVEVYRTNEDPARHKETAHYQKWRDTVADMMAEPRTSVKYSNIFPDETGWDYEV